MYCLDASVVVNSFIEGEKYHEFSKKLMDKIKNDAIRVVFPEIVLPEVAHAMSTGFDAKTAIEFVANLRKIPTFTFVPIDAELSNLASRCAATYKMRGADSLYVAVSYTFNAKLITLDLRQKESAKNIVTALTPVEELRASNK